MINFEIYCSRYQLTWVIVMKEISESKDNINFLNKATIIFDWKSNMKNEN
jgi:hypothetical protein